ncbi:IS3 family transposase [uncultured Anaerococcus sp.]|uniref:IS3 family transposase n=1 Tax=uncultured Anaerococcus sp. TaxID=293428 RepID=UPI00288C4B9A|nr:IS3 family transposase [uncultured Anaerococcus sp.]
MAKKRKRKKPDTEILEKILEIRKEHEDWGCKRIHGYLSKTMHINIKKVHRIIKENNLQVETYHKRNGKYNSYRGKIGKVADNLIDRNFKSEKPHKKITTDTTEFKYYEKDKTGIYQIKKLYLNPYLDMYNSEIISYSISKKPNYAAIEKALYKAMQVTKDQKEVIYHSDQGWLYQIPRYVNKLKNNEIIQSMSRKGNCLDNSIMENFFSLIKQEMYNKKTFYSYEELETAIIEYIDYYNNRRIKEKLNYMSPVEYRLYNENNKPSVKFNKSPFSIEKGLVIKNHANSYFHR